MHVTVDSDASVSFLRRPCESGHCSRYSLHATNKSLLTDTRGSLRAAGYSFEICSFAGNLRSFETSRPHFACISMKGYSCVRVSKSGVCALSLDLPREDGYDRVDRAMIAVLHSPA